MKNLFDSILGVVKGLVQREAARLIAWSSAAATAAALAIASNFGVEISAEFIAAIGIFVAALATELIRMFVYSEQTVKEIVEEVKEEI